MMERFHEAFILKQYIMIFSVMVFLGSSDAWQNSGFSLFCEWR